MVPLVKQHSVCSLDDLSKSGSCLYYIGGDTHATFNDEWLKSVAGNGGAAMLLTKLQKREIQLVKFNGNGTIKSRRTLGIDDKALVLKILRREARLVRQHAALRTSTGAIGC